MASDRPFKPNRGAVPFPNAPQEVATALLCLSQPQTEEHRRATDLLGAADLLSGVSSTSASPPPACQRVPRVNFIGVSGGTLEPPFNQQRSCYIVGRTNRQLLEGPLELTLLTDDRRPSARSSRCCRVDNTLVASGEPCAVHADSFWVGNDSGRYHFTVVKRCTKCTCTTLTRCSRHHSVAKFGGDGNACCQNCVTDVVESRRRRRNAGEPAVVERRRNAREAAGGREGPTYSSWDHALPVLRSQPDTPADVTGIVADLVAQTGTTEGFCLLAPQSPATVLHAGSASAVVGSGCALALSVAGGQLQLAPDCRLLVSGGDQLQSVSVKILRAEKNTGAPR